MSDCPPGCRVNFNIFYLHPAFVILRRTVLSAFVRNMTEAEKDQVTEEILFDREVPGSNQYEDALYRLGTDSFII